MDRADVLSLGVRGDDLGCVRGLTVPTAAGGGQANTVKPVSVKTEIISSEVTILWREISIYRANGPLRLAGPIYEVTSYETKAGCEAAQEAAMAKEALFRVRPMTERLSDGIKTWTRTASITLLSAISAALLALPSALPVDPTGGNSRRL
jgi:hypothetical protein